MYVKEKATDHSVTDYNKVLYQHGRPAVVVCVTAVVTWGPFFNRAVTTLASNKALGSCLHFHHFNQSVFISFCAAEYLTLKIIGQPMTCFNVNDV